MASSPWVPLLDDKALPPCDLIEDLILEGFLPTSRNTQHRPWSLLTLNKSLDRYRSLREPVWECVVALFRLHSVEKEGLGNKTWRQHVSAWLVSPGRLCSFPGLLWLLRVKHRYRDLLWQSDLEPLPVLADFLNAMKMTERFKTEPLPSFSRELPPSSPAISNLVEPIKPFWPHPQPTRKSVMASQETGEPTPRPQPTRKSKTIVAPQETEEPTPRPQPTRKLKAVVAPQETDGVISVTTGASSDGLDGNWSDKDSGKRDSDHPMRGMSSEPELTSPPVDLKGKAKVGPPRGAKGLARCGRGSSTASSNQRKRVARESFEGVVLEVKRPKGVVEVDLSDQTYAEDSVITEKMVPGLAGVVSGFQLLA